MYLELISLIRGTAKSCALKFLSPGWLVAGEKMPGVNSMMALHGHHDFSYSSNIEWSISITTCFVLSQLMVSIYY